MEISAKLTCHDSRTGIPAPIGSPGEIFMVSDSLLEKLEQLPEENAYETFQTLDSG